MKSRIFCAMWLSAACAMFVAGTEASASSGASPSSNSNGAAAKNVKSGATAATAGRATSILGAAWKADNSPIPNAKVRLRNRLTGRVVANTVANEIGQFAFTGIEDGEFAIELVSDAGKVLALVRLIVAPGDTIVTFVRQNAPAPSWVAKVFDRLFKDEDAQTGDGEQDRDKDKDDKDKKKTVAEEVTAAAASTGITAMLPEEVRPVSGRQ